jgi:hypothetical protein
MGTLPICKCQFFRALRREELCRERELFLKKGLHFWRESDILGGLISEKGAFLQKERGPKYRRDRRVIYRFDVCQLI